MKRIVAQRAQEMDDDDFDVSEDDSEDGDEDSDELRDSEDDGDEGEDDGAGKRAGGNRADKAHQIDAEVSQRVSMILKELKTYESRLVKVRTSKKTLHKNLFNPNNKSQKKQENGD